MYEQWRHIEYTNGVYQVSSLGRVRRKYLTGGVWCYRILIQRLHNGYPIINLCYKGVKQTFSVHRLVAEAFIPNPKKYPQINHLNGIKADNQVINLEWVSPKQNTKHAVENKLYYHRPLAQVNLKGQIVKIWESGAIAARTLGFHKSSISKAARGIIKTSYGFQWIFKDELRGTIL